MVNLIKLKRETSDNVLTSGVKLKALDTIIVYNVSGTAVQTLYEV